MDFIDFQYDYKGRFGVESRCGIKIAAHAGKTVIIATELYDGNPGTSVTQGNARIAADLCRERGIDPEKMIFIEHCPDRGSKLENYGETFDLVTFRWNGPDPADPEWKRLTRAEVAALLGE